jgi:hypothetical protein
VIAGRSATSFLAILRDTISDDFTVASASATAAHHAFAKFLPTETNLAAYAADRARHRRVPPRGSI